MSPVNEEPSVFFPQFGDAVLSVWDPVVTTPLLTLRPAGWQLLCPDDCHGSHSMEWPLAVETIGYFLKLTFKSSYSCNSPSAALPCGWGSKSMEASDDPATGGTWCSGG